MTRTIHGAQLVYHDTKANLAALTGLPADTKGFATDTHESGWFDGSAWHWVTEGGGNGNVLGPATNSDNYLPQWDGANTKTLKNGLPITTTVGTPGVDTNIPTEKAVRTAVAAVPVGDVVGPASATDSHLAVFNGVTGKLLKDGGALPIVTSVGTPGSDGNIPSEKAVRTAIAGFGNGNVTGPVSNTDGSIPQWNGANSKTLKDGLPLVTSVGSPGADTNVPTEKAVRTAITAVAAGREKLSADRTYYVRTNGSDSNNGLANTAGGAFLTIQHACDVSAALDTSIYNVTIQVADGTYVEAINISDLHGSGTISITGNTSTPANAVVDGGFYKGSGTTTAILAGFTTKKVSGPTDVGIYTEGGTIVFAQWIFGAGLSTHIWSDLAGRIVSTDPYTVTSGAQTHIFCGINSFYIGYGNVTFTGTPNFTTVYCSVGYGGYVDISSLVYTGSVTGKRFTVGVDSLLFTAGGFLALPGNVAGTVDPGGSYDGIIAPPANRRGSVSIVTGTSSATLSGTNIVAGAIFELTGTTGRTFTLDTGTNISAAFAALYGTPSVGDVVTFLVKSSGTSSGTITMAGATGATLSSRAVIAIGTSVQFWCRNTGTNTWTIY